MQSLIDKFDILRNNMNEISPLLNKILGIENPTEFIIEVLSSLIPPASTDKLSKLFDDDFEVGTFFLSERINRPDFISAADNLPFKVWLQNNITNEIERLKLSNPESFQEICKQEKEKGISVHNFVFLSMFLLDKKTNKLLVEQIPNQIYQDVFTRIMAFFAFGNVHAYPYVEKDYNEKIEAVSYAILDNIGDSSIFDLFRYSIAAGALGVDMKSSASAASPIHKGIKNIIFYHVEAKEPFNEKVQRMTNELSMKIKEPLSIDFWKEFESEFVKNEDEKTLLWFHDDCAETIIDLFFIQRLLSDNKFLKIISIPRSGKHGIRFGNDASSMDISRHLNSKYFSVLKGLQRDGSYRYSDMGPCWGAVHGLHLSEEVVDLILQSSSILVKGSRSYEMLQGIHTPAYFASMVCRDFSESVFDIDAESGASILIKQEAALPSFQGFRERSKRIRTLSNGKKIMLSSMTAKDYEKAIRHPNYEKIVSKFPTKLEANIWIKNEAKKNQQTISSFILDSNF